MGHGSRAFLAGGLGFAVAFVVACGGQNGLLTGNQASNLNGALTSVSSAVAAGQCGAATSAATDFNNQVAALPRNVNTTLIQNLGQGAATLRDAAATDCQSSSSSSSSSTSKSSSSSSSSSTSSPTTTNPTSSTSPSSTSSTPSSSSSSGTATNSPGTSTNTTSNGGAGIGGTTGNGGAGAGANKSGQ